MQLRRNTSTSYGKVFCLALLGAALIFLPFLIWDRGIFLYAGDYNVQQIPFYQLAGESIRSGNFFWDWGTDLGTNFIGTYSFYLLGSPFFWLTVALPRAVVPYVMGPLLMVKIALSAVTSYAFLRRFTHRDSFAVLGGLLYAFSSFSIYNIFFNHFHEVILTFPLLLLSLELFMTEHRRGFFACMVALCAVTNYFFFVGEVVFLFVYFFIRVGSGSYKLTLSRFVSLAAESVLGVGLAAVLLLPAVLAILGNPRVAENTSGLNWLVYGNDQKYLSIWMNLFFPAEVPYAPNFFAGADVKWKSVAAYLPMFSMTGVFAYCMAKKGTWLRRTLITCLVMAFVPVLNSAFILFNSSYYARWFYMPVLLMVLATITAFEHLPREDLNRGIRYTAIWTAIMCVFAVVPEISDDGVVTLSALCDYPFRFWIGACVAFLGICFTALFADKVRTDPHCIRFAVCGVLLTTTLSGWLYMVEGKSSLEWDLYFMENCLSARDSAELPVSDTFCRYDFQNCEDNQGMFFGVPSIHAFNSVVPASIMEYYPYIGVKRDVSSKPEAYQYQTRALTSTRYLVADQNDEYEEVRGFVKIGSDGAFDFYENTNYLPMGFCYDKMIARSLLDQADVYQRSGIMMSALCIEDRDLAEAYRYLPTVWSDVLDESQTYEKFRRDVEERRQSCTGTFTVCQNGFDATVQLEKENLVFYSVPYDEGWTAYVNGEPAKIYKANVGFMAVACPAGASTVEFRYVSPGFREGVVITVSCALLLGIYLVLTKKVRWLSETEKPTQTDETEE